MASPKKKQKIKRYFTIMIVPDNTVSRVRSLNVPHTAIYCVGIFLLTMVTVISCLSLLNSYSQKQLLETAKILEENAEEKQELLNEKEKIELAKKKIEDSLSSQQGDFDKQLDFYKEQLIEIEAKLYDIEKKAETSYEKMDVFGSPVSKKTIESFTGGAYSPHFDSETSKTDQINLLIAMVNVEMESTVDYLEEFSEDVEKFVAYRDAFPNDWPVTGRVTSEQGSRSDPINGSAANHTGIDIKAAIGTPVRATGNGVVTRAEYNSGYGYMVIINHGYGYETYYAHNSQLKVRKGQQVKRGDIIALSGNTGRSTGPHVHYEVRYNGAIKNPRNYFGAIDK